MSPLFLAPLFGAAFLVSTMPGPRMIDVHRESLTRTLSLPAATRSAGVPQIAPPIATLPRPTHNLFAAALRWGMLQSSDVDDCMLALTSPESFWLIRSWRQRMYGDQRGCVAALHAARQQLSSGDVLEPALRKRMASVSVRGKSLWSTFHKAAVQQRQVHDVLALRVIVKGDDEAACFETLERMRAAWPSVGGRFKDYISAPKANGYRAIHDTVLLPGGRPMEIQIRTEAQHATAEYGSASHRRYKGAAYLLPRTMLAGVGAAPAPFRRSPLRWAM